MDTLAKETMGLPIFICPTNHQIISSGGSGNTTTSSTSSAFRTSNPDSAGAPLSPTSPTSSTQYSPTTSFFATATATRSPVSVTFPSVLPTATPTNRDSTTTINARRNTYIPPTFSPDHRRESLLSTHRLSAAFDFASAFASEVLSKAADQVFGNEEVRTEAGMLWNEDLEAGEREREKEKGGRYSRFGEEGTFESWLD